MTARELIVAGLRLQPPATASEQTQLQAIWEASQDQDELAGRPRGGWWSIHAWAASSLLLYKAGQAIGVAAVEYQRGAPAAEARLALLPTARSRGAALRLIQAALELGSGLGARTVRLYAPRPATWALEAAQAHGFIPTRAQHTMLRFPTAQELPAVAVPGVTIRALQEDEDQALLAALNAAWADTWNFKPLTLEQLQQDLAGQRGGMLIAVEAGDSRRIVGSCHALFDPGDRNPDDTPYAWISNLTTVPNWRGRGLGRALLSAGVRSLVARGARSVALGVDGGNSSAIRLYHAVGFQVISSVMILEAPVWPSTQLRIGARRPKDAAFHQQRLSAL